MKPTGRLAALARAGAGVYDGARSAARGPARSGALFVRCNSPLVTTRMGYLVTIKRSSVTWPMWCPLCDQRASFTAVTFSDGPRVGVYHTIALPVCRECRDVIRKLWINIAIASAFAVLGAALFTVSGWRMVVGAAGTAAGAATAAASFWRLLRTRGALRFRAFTSLDNFWDLRSVRVESFDVYCRYPNYAAVLAAVNGANVKPTREWVQWFRLSL